VVLRCAGHVLGGGDLGGAVMARVERIGGATLYLGDCREILPTLGKVDAVVTDPPYSARTHKGHDLGAASRRDGADRLPLGYAALSNEDCYALAGLFCDITQGWIVWMHDHTLAPSIHSALSNAGRYVFAPLPYFHAGRSVRLTGDGPSSWTDWITVARTSKQLRWGTLPGGYVATDGWNDKARMGGKPTRLMSCLVTDYSKLGNVVCDPFMGAGTTGVACAREGRRFVGVEIDEVAFDVACRRIEQAQRQADLFVKPVEDDAYDRARQMDLLE
jgi:site-specific DNA-methyltransferase (adenine-specific)